MPVPTAEVTRQCGRAVTVRCPYCGHEHTHTVLRSGQSERFAPGCGMFRSNAQRVAGYTFTTAPDARGPH